MIRKSLIAAALALSSCQSNSQPVPVTTPGEAFANEHLLFDMKDEVSGFPCLVSGTVPGWLSGALLRNGPAKFQVGDKRVEWFDGLAMLHVFEFSSGKVAYSNRFLRSEQYFIMMDEKSLEFSGFAQDPCPKVFKDQISKEIPAPMKGIHNADVSIQAYADQMVALTEVPMPVVFDPETLETVGNFQYQDKLVQGQWESAHPQRDPITGETVNYFIRFGRNTSYVIWKMQNGEAGRSVIAEVPVKRPSYMHSFALTEHYVVLVEFPFVVNPIDLKEKKKPFIFNYRWKPELGTEFLVVERSSGKSFKIKGDPFFAFHHVNAFDKEGKIYIDIVTHPNANIMNVVTDQMDDQKSIEESETTRLQRFTIDVAQQELKSETLFDQTVELPRVASERVAQEYQYCYAVDMRFPTTMQANPALYQIDVNAKTAKSWSEAGCFPGEPIFVARPGATKENDGVVLSVVLDFARNSSFLLVIDANGFNEIARAKVPNPIPVGLHGLWDAKN
ncbi:MAG: carotenoid oxygenase family protein [Parachlamydiales bacterium]|nr:carotenoid oxygenase family protein [Candidatus Acheromyda pituitae]